MRYFISINYVEPNPEEYVSLNLSETFSDKEWVFDSGNFGEDWGRMMKHIIINNETFSVSYSSSVDHFIMDGAEYDSAYLFVDGEGSYLDYEDFDGIEMFVPKGSKPNWDEYRELYKLKEKNK